MDAQTYCSMHKEFMRIERDRLINVFDKPFRSQISSSGTISKDFVPGIKKSLEKDAKTSKHFLSKGGKTFKKKKHSLEDHLDIWENYSQCIACAPNDSLELAEGYYARAAFFFHIKNYEECQKDCIRGSILNKCSENLKSKFECLKTQCRRMFVKSKFERKEAPDIIFPEHEVEILNKNDKIPCASDAVSIGFSEEYGRMIVATRDIKPGEVLVKEKFFAQIPMYEDIMMHCFNCSKIAYSSIPCDTCAYAMFCSDACKKQAWKDYHKIECILMNEFCFKNNKIFLVILSLRILLKIALKVSSIENFKRELENFDNCEDPLQMGFSEGIFESDKWSSILTLSIKSSIASEKNIKEVSLCSAACVYYLGSQTGMFDDALKTSDDFIKNDDALFIGTVLSRLIHIIMTNRFPVYEEQSLEPRRFRDFVDDLMTIALNTSMHRTKLTGMGLSAFSSFFNHGCIQDVTICVTENMHRLHIAVRPIKKDSQICFCYNIKLNGFMFPKSERLEELKKFDFICKCVACEENWDSYFDSKPLGDFEKRIFRPIGDFEVLLNAKLKSLRKYLKKHKLCHSEIYRDYGIIIDFYRARFSPWCEIPKCT